MCQSCYLVIGGDGFMGRNITEELRKSGKRVITTSRRSRNLSESCIYLDLSKDVLSWEFPKDIDAAFFCAAVPSIEQCRSNPEGSRVVNVESIIALASRFAGEGISVIFPSTNLVFDGQRPNRETSDPVCPLTEYGRQKAMAENGLMALGQHISIVRLTKIIGPKTQPFNGWIKQLKNKTVINPFSDMFFSPVSIDFVSKVMIEIADSKKDGIWHISAKEDITYEESARYIARKINVSQKYVQPIKVNDSGLEFESIPRYTTLNTSRTEDELGFTPPHVWEAFNSILDL